MLRWLYLEYYSLAKHIAQSRNSLASYSSTTARGVYGEMLHIGILPEIPHRYKAGKTIGFIIESVEKWIRCIVGHLWPRTALFWRKRSKIKSLGGTEIVLVEWS